MGLLQFLKGNNGLYETATIVPSNVSKSVTSSPENLDAESVDTDLTKKVYDLKRFTWIGTG